MLRFLFWLLLLKRVSNIGVDAERFSLVQAASFLHRRAREEIPGTPPLERGEKDYQVRLRRQFLLLQKLASPNSMVCIRSRDGWHFYQIYCRLNELPNANRILEDIHTGAIRSLKRPYPKRRLTSPEGVMGILEEGAALATDLEGQGPMTSGSFFTYIELPGDSRAVRLLKKALKRSETGPFETYANDTWRLVKMSATWRLIYKKLPSYGRDSNTPWIYDRIAEHLNQRGLNCRTYFSSD